MAKARKEVEIAVRVGNRPAALGEALAVIAVRGVNVLAYCSYSDRDDLMILLITDNALKAMDSLRAAGFSCKANSVVLVGASTKLVRRPGLVPTSGWQGSKSSIRTLRHQAASSSLPSSRPPTTSARFRLLRFVSRLERRREKPSKAKPLHRRAELKLADGALVDSRGTSTVGGLGLGCLGAERPPPFLLQWFRRWGPMRPGSSSVITRSTCG